jgi:ABC-2 type transport system permease protein
MNHMKKSARTTSVWKLILKQELAELWLGGRALNLLVLFSVLMSITSFLLATNSELNLTPPNVMEEITLQAIITFGLFIGLVIAGESFSGERERATLEPLLLAPTSRRQIVLGKFLSSMSPWVSAAILAIPYMAILSQGDPIVWTAMFWGLLIGTLMSIVFTGIGTIVSIFSRSSRMSLFVSLMIYLISLLPQELPGEIKGTLIGNILQFAGPLEASRTFINHILVLGNTFSEEWTLLIVIILTPILILALLFLYAAPRLHLEGDQSNARASSFGRIKIKL